LDDLGNPQRAYRTIHVGGTNGKGSVTSMIASALRWGGHRVGCYTSPHLCSFRERMLVDGCPISEDGLLQYAQDARDAVVRHDLTFFEATTVLAMHAFAAEGVEVAVMEVGLGGRLDATNVIEPAVSAVTNVAMDHADFLGDSLAAIAMEKAGIMKRGVPFVTAETDPEILALFERRAGEVGCSVSVVRSERLSGVEVTAEHTAFCFTTDRWGAVALRTPLIGAHQAWNGALAVSVLEALDDDLRPGMDDVARGLATVVHHGRDEIVRRDGRAWLLDVAHNTAGILSLVDTIDRLDLPRPLVVLVGVLGDKDWRSMLPPLMSRADAAFLTQPPSAPVERRWDAAEAADQVDALTSVRVVDDFDAALARAAERAEGGTVVVTGSVHTVGSAMSRLGLDPLSRESPGAEVG
jgi:dihydrofolate synthase/folylpolyglutamate synthase